MKKNYTITGSNMICSSEDVPAREQVKEVDVPARELKARGFSSKIPPDGT